MPTCCNDSTCRPNKKKQEAPMISCNRMTNDQMDVHGPRWETKRKLGEGGCGTVSLAFDPSSGFEFVVKTVKPSDAAAEADLANELAVLHKVQACPHALKCLGSATNVDEQGRAHVRVLFLEYMDGGSLQDAVKQASFNKKKAEGLPEASVAFFARAILEGLEELHQLGILHCDIKCANVLLRHVRHPPSSSADQEAKKKKVQDEELEVKLGDFGISREYDSFSCMGRGACGQFKMRGTLSHMAPEVAEGRGPCPASDVWSLGCTVVEMLQGSAPWGSGQQALLRQAMGEPPHLPHHLSKACKDFLQRCLQREPSARCTPRQLLSHPFLQLGAPGMSAISSAPLAATDDHQHGLAIGLHALAAALKSSLHHAHHHHHDHHRRRLANFWHHRHNRPTAASCAAVSSQLVAAS